MPAPGVHHPKPFEPPFEHVYVAIPHDDQTRSDLCSHVCSNLMVDTLIANADPEEYGFLPSRCSHPRSPPSSSAG